MFPFLWRSQEDDITERADFLLERFLLDAKREDFAGSLSGGQRKLLEMARALMAEPEMVMLDEPMAGVNPALKQSLLGHVKSLRDEGRTVLFVEHDMDMVRDISDWVIVMAQGKIIAEGPPDSVMSDKQVIDAYLGSHHDQDLSTMEEAVLAEAQAEITGTPAADRDSAGTPASDPRTGTDAGAGRAGRPTPTREYDRDRDARDIRARGAPRAGRGGGAAGPTS